MSNYKVLYLNDEYDDDHLEHFGVRGMKWGVRRYQNYDGSYTQAGIKRYRKAEQEYESDKANYEKVKAAYKSGTATKNELKEAKQYYKDSKADLKTHYKHLKQDKLADQGKEIYQKGGTITSDNSATYAIAAGASIATSMLYNIGKEKASAAVAAGGIGVVAGKMIYDHYRAVRLRAYYSHTSNYIRDRKHREPENDESISVKTGKTAKTTTNTVKTAANKVSDDVITLKNAKVAPKDYEKEMTKLSGGWKAKNDDDFIKEFNSRFESVYGDVNLNNDDRLFELYSNKFFDEYFKWEEGH